MKILKFNLLSLIVFLSLGLFSCSSDDDSSSDQNSDTCINFTIDGMDYSFTDIITVEPDVIHKNIIP